eukprot:c9422_g1_i1.p1 GENE.c9422_g1_i1~~c9422_g1_i1.p1  ORF type:complete len:561 (+),score=135.46 c9422_g1_i1:142-1683(+)
MTKDGTTAAIQFADPPFVSRVFGSAQKLDVSYVDSKGKVKTEQYTFETAGDAEAAYALLRAFRPVAARSTPNSIATDALPRQEVTVFVGSMNMGDAPTQADLSAWIVPGHGVYAFSLQEAGYKPEGGGSAEAHIQATIQTQLGEGYSPVAVLSLGPIRNLVFARADLAPLISNVASATEATGIGHVGSNKGGVGISFSLAESSFLFVAAHLAAHDGEVERRNSDYREILTGLGKLAPRGVCASDHFDHVFWAGDLNYRLELGRDEAIALITAGNLERLLVRDQLKAQHTEAKVFAGFTEGPITFTPTYKFNPGTREFDNKKMRTPSYTDRILFRTSPLHTETTVQTRYDACHTIMTSDHSPIFALFNTSVILRPLVIPRPAPTAATLTFSRLAGRGLKAMDLNGFSDPYIVFGGGLLDLNKDEGRSATVKKSLDPAWDEAMTFKLSAATPVALASLPVLVVVYDEDKTSKDDIIGAGWLNVAAALAAPDGAFEVQLRAIGQFTGVLTGRVALA